MLDMNSDQISISLVLLAALILFAWGRWRYDLVAMFCLLTAVILGVVPENDAFSGFGHPAVVTVAAILILSQGLHNAGVVGMITSWIRQKPMGSIRLLTSLTLIVTVLSAFMNNVGALALMLPVTMMAASEYKIPPSILLMPLAFGSILGGLTTLIGTPPNIIIATYRSEVLGAPYSMFDFTPVGVPIALAGVAFISLIGWRLIPAARRQKNASQKLFEINSYLTEIRIPNTCRCIGLALHELPLLGKGAIEVLGIARAAESARPVQKDYILQAGDILIVRADPVEIRPLLDQYEFELLTSATHVFQKPDRHSSIMLEGVMSKASPLVQRDVRFMRRLSGHSIALVGLARQGRPLVRRLRRQVFKPGDVLLLLGHEDTIDEQFSQLGLWPLAHRPLELDRNRKTGVALLAFLGAVILSMSNLVSLPMAFILTVMIYVLTGIIRVREIYARIDWAVIVLLGAMIPVGRALETTGTTAWMTNNLLALVGSHSPVLMLTLLMITTLLLSSIINNAATALVMAPIAITSATELQVNPDAFLMAVAISASCAFLTPIGHQSNTLVLGPGGYEFGDYWRMGLPLEIVIVALGVPLILWVWPL